MKYATLKKDDNYKAVVSLDIALEEYLENYSSASVLNRLPSLLKELKNTINDMKKISAKTGIAKLDPQIKNSLIYIAGEAIQLHEILTKLKEKQPSEAKKQILNRISRIQAFRESTSALILHIANDERIDHTTNVSVTLKKNIIAEIKFKINRPSFLTSTLSLFSHRKRGEDLCHWKGNEVMKQEIKRMFEGQTFVSVAAHLVEKGYSVSIKTIPQLQDALYDLWTAKFNNPSNLRVEKSASNEALGTLVSQLKKTIEAGEENFEAFWLNMKAFGIENRDNPKHPNHVFIDSWEMLKDYYFNANFDFNFNRQTISQQLHEAASEFRFVYR